MSDKILVPFGERFLALDRDAFQAALAEGDRILPRPSKPEGLIGGPVPSKLLTAEEMAERTGVPASWFLRAARACEIPFVRFEKYVRFEPAAVIAHLAAVEGYRTSGPNGPPKSLTRRAVSDLATRNVPKSSGRDRPEVGARNGR